MVDTVLGVEFQEVGIRAAHKIMRRLYVSVQPYPVYLFIYLVCHLDTYFPLFAFYKGFQLSII